MNFDSERFITCGAMESSGGGYSDIVCDTTNGDCVFLDEMIGNCIFENINVKDPQLCEKSYLMSLIDKYQSMGIIVTQTQFIVLRQDEAEFRPFSNNMEIAQTVYTDLSTEFEDD